MNVEAIRVGLARRCEDYEPAFASVYATVPDSVVTPSVAVLPADPFIAYHQTAAGTRGPMNAITFDLIVFAARFDSRYGQDLLDGVLSGLPAVLEADQSLGGEAEVVTVTEAMNYGAVAVGGQDLIGARLVTEVHAR